MLSTFIREILEGRSSLLLHLKVRRMRSRRIFQVILSWSLMFHTKHLSMKYQDTSVKIAPLKVSTRWV